MGSCLVVCMGLALAVGCTTGAGPVAPAPSLADARLATLDAAPASDAVPSPEPARATQLELTFAGDIIFGGLFKDQWFESDIPNQDPLADMAPLLASDLALVNLETTVVNTIPTIKGDKRFAARPEQVALLQKNGIHAVTIANNHIADLDQAGLTETPERLRELGLPFIGGPRDANTPLFRVESMLVRGWNIGFIAATTKLNRQQKAGGVQVPYVSDPKKLKDLLVPVIAEARATHDLIIVVLHWGVQYADEPSPWQIEAAHAFVDAGADAVIGHHPHVLQGIERYKNSVIAYSLGNFVFRNAEVPSRYTGVLRLGFSSDDACMDTVVFHPAVQRRTPLHHPVVATGDDLRGVEKRLVGLSAAEPLSTAWTLADDRFVTTAACPRAN